MVVLSEGNMFDTPAEAWVNAVNCVGIMGKGIALEFKSRFPAMYDSYRSACAQGDVQVGAMHVWESAAPAGPRLVINFPTKRHWRDTSRLSDIEAGLRALAVEIVRRRIRSIAIPALGCGLGGLAWPEVFASMERVLTALDGVKMFIFPPQVSGRLSGRR